MLVGKRVGYEGRPIKRKGKEKKRPPRNLSAFWSSGTFAEGKSPNENLVPPGKLDAKVFGSFSGLNKEPRSTKVSYLCIL